MLWLAKIFQLILAIPSIFASIKSAIDTIRDLYLKRREDQKAEKLKKHTDALEKAQEDGNVDAQKDGLSSVIDDVNS